MLTIEVNRNTESPKFYIIESGDPLRHEPWEDAAKRAFDATDDSQGRVTVTDAHTLEFETYDLIKH